MTELQGWIVIALLTALLAALLVAVVEIAYPIHRNIINLYRCIDILSVQLENIYKQLAKDQPLKKEQKFQSYP
jgi:hypothetical protein